MNESDKHVVYKMILIYCKAHHSTSDTLCGECVQILEYAGRRLEKCKYGNQKPTCEKCGNSCYAPLMRTQIQKIMRYAGPRMIYKHPTLAIRHLINSLK